MRISTWLGSTAVILQSSLPCMAWDLHPDCEPYAADVTVAMGRFLKVAKYAVARANDPDPNHRLGTLLQDLLGATDENDPAALADVTNWIGQAINTANGEANGLGGLLIHCTDAHLVSLLPEEGIYRDPDFNVQVHVPRPAGQLSAGVTNACAGQLTAFAYPTFSKSVIVLCSDSIKGAINTIRPNHDADFQKYHTGAGDIRKVKEVSIDVFSIYLSYILFHEMMHAANFFQFPGALPDADISGQRPSELYGYLHITNNPPGQIPNPAAPATVNNRRHNADSYALLACGWYITPMIWTKGQPSRVPKTFLPPQEYPGTAKLRRTRYTKKKRVALAPFDIREPVKPGLF